MVAVFLLLLFLRMSRVLTTIDMSNSGYSNGPRLEIYIATTVLWYLFRYLGIM